MIPTPAQAFWNQRSVLSRSRERILKLCETVGRPIDLNPYQWAQLMVMALEFAPDLILELGRGDGNSTCAFTEAANLLRPLRCRVVSLDRGDTWQRRTAKKIRAVVGNDWFEPLQALKANILTFDFGPVLADARKILIFWDAHGYKVAECILGQVLPSMAERPHVVIVHDLSDARYLPRSTDEYGGRGIWMGEAENGPRLRIGHIDTLVEEAISLVDFTERNKLPFHSADESFFSTFDSQQQAELRRLLGEELFSLNAHWFWFSMNEGAGPFTFPRYTPPEIRKSRPISFATRLKIAIKVLFDRYPTDRLS